MKKKDKSRFDNKFNSQTRVSGRKENVRKEKPVRENIPLILFNFKDFTDNQCPPGQTFKEWEKDGLLADFLCKLVSLSQKNRVNACQEGAIHLYESYPEKSDFKKPEYINGEVKWGTIQDIGGQKHRVAGYMIDNVFYVVFLDKEHKFWKTDR